MTARGTWTGEEIVVEDEAEASRIVDKTSAGRREGTRLQLDRVEAAWLATEGRLELEGTTLASLLSGPAEIPYLVYCDLRQRGLVCRWTPSDGVAGEGAGAGPSVIEVWERGQSPPAEPAWKVAVHSEQDRVQAAALAAWAGHHLGIVDEDGVVTYYRLLALDPQGTVPVVPLSPVAAEPLAEHVLAASLEPYEKEGIGTPHPAGLLLSRLEAAHLRSRGVLEPEGSGPAPPATHLAVFDDLRRRGVVARSGLRFGAHLRGYTARPDSGHAEWLLHCAAPDQDLEWSVVSRGVRLAHGVRKTFVVAVSHPDVVYAGFAWHRP